MSERVDLIVVGLGAMGSAVAYHASRLGMSVIGIDRHDPPHSLGSTHAETRITRLAVGEGPQYLPFVARSHQLWRELEDESGTQLLHQTGGYIVTSASPGGDRWNDFTVVTDRIAAEAGIEYHLLSPAELVARQRQLIVPGDMRVGYEPTGGIVMAERAVAAHITVARQNGASIKTNEVVTQIDPTSAGVVVTTSQGAYSASNVVLAAGPWVADLASPSIARYTTVTRQVVYWFEVDDVAAFSVGHFPFVMWIGDSIDEYLAVFPIPPGGTPGVKVLGEQFVHTTTAETVDRSVSRAEIDDFFERNIESRIRGVRPECIRTAVCLYTNTPDDHFLIDSDARSDRILVMSPCSGHGFKHSPALGEAVAQRLSGGASVNDLAPFARSRLR